MNPLKRSLTAVAVAALMTGGAAQAQISDNVIKIGVLSDMSSLYTDLAGAGSVAGAIITGGSSSATRTTGCPDSSRSTRRRNASTSARRDSKSFSGAVSGWASPIVPRSAASSPASTSRRT